MVLAVVPQYSEYIKNFKIALIAALARAEPVPLEFEQ
jgi:hypothetical protein